MPSADILTIFEKLRRSTVEVVYVEWLDSRSVTYLSAASARKEGLLLMSTAGLLIGEDDQVLRLALDFWSFDDDGDYAERYRYVAIIPKAAIQRRQQWDVIPPLVQNPDSDPKLAASWRSVHINDPSGEGLTYSIGQAKNSSVVRPPPLDQELTRDRSGSLDQRNDTIVTPWVGPGAPGSRRFGYADR